MVKKMHKTAQANDSTGAAQNSAAGGLLDSQLAQTVKDSAHQIWLAGLGAFAKAQGGGSKVFDALMKEGASLQRKTQTVAEETLGDVAGKMTAMAGEVGHKANAQWDKLETIFEERTARALGRLGVPSAKALAALEARVDTLAAAVAHLGGAAAPAAKRAKAAKADATDTATTGAASATSGKPAKATAAAPMLAKSPKFRPGKAMLSAKPVVAPAAAAKPATSAASATSAKPAARKRAKPAA